MSKNPGDRFPKPTTVAAVRTEVVKATRGTIVYFRPILSLLLVLVALGALEAGWQLTALFIAVAAGRLSLGE